MARGTLATETRSTERRKGRQKVAPRIVRIESPNLRIHSPNQHPIAWRSLMRRGTAFSGRLSKMMLLSACGDERKLGLKFHHHVVARRLLIVQLFTGLVARTWSPFAWARSSARWRRQWSRSFSQAISGYGLGAPLLYSHGTSHFRRSSHAI